MYLKQSLSLVHELPQAVDAVDVKNPISYLDCTLFAQWNNEISVPVYICREDCSIVGNIDKLQGLQSSIILSPVSHGWGIF